MRTHSVWISTLSAAVAAAFLCGCLDLKPARATARYFVLAPVSPPVAAAPGSVPASGPVIGVAPVKLPPYLFKSFLAVRKSPNEVEYLESALWAESLDQGFLRALAADLAARVPTDQLRLSAWHAADVTCEVYVTLEQFDVDEQGKGIISAWWRVLSPGGDKTLKSGRFRASHQGPHPKSDPQGAVSTLSELTGELGAEVAQAVASLR